MTRIRLADSRGSKRMYDKRFREWNVFKNVNSDDKTRAPRRGQQPPPPSDQADVEGMFSNEDLRKALRCARSIQRGVKRVPVPSSPVSPVAKQSTPPPELSRQPRRSISISDLLKPEDNLSGITVPGSPGQERAPLTPSSQFDASADTQVSSPGSTIESTREQDGRAAIVPARIPGPGMAAYQAQLQDLFQGPLHSLSPEAKTRTLGIITHKLHEYYDWQLENIPQGVLPDDYLGNRTPDESARYWSTLKHAFYLVKVSADSVEHPDTRPDRRAWSAFSEAGSLAAGAMTSQPFDFLRNLFATLSPVNTNARPELRGILLRFLTSQANTSLSSNHPITHICQELQQDEGCPEISQRSLQCMLDIFNRRLGRSRAITFKLLDSLATLLRRSGEYQAGLEIVSELLKSARPVFGAESDQARSIENELAHFYMLTDQPDLALGHCMSVITRPPRPASSASVSPPGSQASHATYYEEGIAAHAMEDIAEIHQRRGDMEQSIAWLERAASIALTVWGPKSIATGHLIDKMTTLQRQFGKDLLKSATFWEAALDSSSD